MIEDSGPHDRLMNRTHDLQGGESLGGTVHFSYAVLYCRICVAHHYLKVVAKEEDRQQDLRNFRVASKKKYNQREAHISCPECIETQIN